MAIKRTVMKTLVLAVCLALVGAVAGCAARKEPQKEKVLNVHLYLKPYNLSPVTTGHGQDKVVLRAVFKPLVELTDKYEVVPALAERWEVSPDATTFTFYLPKNARWHDGKPVTADDVVFSFHIMLNPKSGSINVGKLLGIRGAKDYKEGKADKVAGVVKVDDKTVRIELERPNVAFLSFPLTDVLVIPKHVFESVPLDQLGQWQTWKDRMVGSGPYKFVKYETDQYVELVKNPDYWQGAPKIDRIFFKVLTTDVAVAQAEKGEVDIAAVAPTDAARLEKVPHLNIVSAPGIGIFQAAFNLQQPYLQDKRVRHAFYYAIDREKLLATVLQGHGRVVNSPIIGPAWAVNPSLNPYKYNPEKARELLREAEWDSSRKLVWMYIPGIRDRDEALPVVQQQLKEVGINIEFRPVDAATQSQKVLGGTKDWDIASFGGGYYGVDPHVSSQYYMTAYFTPSGANTTHYSNPKVDELYEKGAAATDQAVRQAIYYEIASILNEDVPTLFFWSNDQLYAINKRVVNCKPKALIEFLPWNAHEWDIVSESK